MPESPWDHPVIESGPAIWKAKKRPTLPPNPSHEDRLKQLAYDVLVAGAASYGRWEDEWPLMTEIDFDTALKRVQDIEFGGQNPDGSHPRIPKAE